MSAWNPIALAHRAVSLRPFGRVVVAAWTRLAFVVALAACTRTLPPPQAPSPRTPECVATPAPTEPPPPEEAVAEPRPRASRPPEIEAMIATLDELRAVREDVGDELPTAASSLVARMRAQTRAWVEHVVEREWQRGTIDLPDKIVGPLREAGLVGCASEACDEQDDLEWGAIGRLEVTRTGADERPPYVIVVVGLRLGVSTDEAVYVFAEDAPGNHRVIAWEQPHLARAIDGRTELAFRLVRRGQHLLLVVEATHLRSMSRWQRRVWTLVTGALDGSGSREAVVYSDSFDIQGVCGNRGESSGYGAAPWLDPDGLTTMGCFYRRSRNGDWGFCERTSRFRWVGARLVPAGRREVCR